ncbi:SPRY domain-containing protein 3 [Lamellibrachia satsuma]|nr:SPRY domain-containing protein 3 [Lamellibrachia satsuma]
MAEWQKPIVLARDIFENQRAHGWVVRRAVARRPVRCEHITVDGDLLRYSPSAGSEGKPGVYISALPMSPLKPGNCYFEMEVLDPGEEGHITVGLMPGNKPRERPHSWKTDSVAYYRSDGRLHAGSEVDQKFGLPWVAGDIVGCGIKLDAVTYNSADKMRIQVFFTMNGQKLSTLHAHLPPDGLHPAIGMCTHSPEGARVRLSLNASWENNDIIPMSIDSWDEEWVRQHGIRLNGQLLEYTGRSPTVGLAQACHPLDTSNHYFEIEIVDPGKACHIAIGVARKDYPKNRLPGWNKGSIAYHADDGKIFIGNGYGEVFGPKCNKGEIMGCGILFPRDYMSEVDMCENLSLAAINDEGDYHSSDSEDDEDDEWVDLESGTKVQVFFTRNGKTIGKREIRIARGGFYPTIGMQTTNEKVRIDLRPLTG